MELGVGGFVKVYPHDRVDRCDECSEHGKLFIIETPTIDRCEWGDLRLCRRHLFQLREMIEKLEDENGEK